MVVKVLLVVTVHSSAAPSTKHEDDPSKLTLETSLFEVMMRREEPALVVKVGVTVKEMELSVFCIQLSLLSSPPDPVKALIKVVGITAEDDVMELYMMGLLS